MIYLIQLVGGPLHGKVAPMQAEIGNKHDHYLDIAEPGGSQLRYKIGYVPPRNNERCQIEGDARELQYTPVLALLEGMDHFVREGLRRAARAIKGEERGR